MTARRNAPVSNPRATRVRMVALAALLAVVAGACGGGGDDEVQMGLKRVALDLAFKTEEEKKEAAAAQAVLREEPDVVFRDTPLAIAPFVPEVERALEPIAPLPRPRRALPVVVKDDCPTAEPGTVPGDPVSVSISKLPNEGRYDYNDKGTFEITGAFSFKGATFPKSAREYKRTAVVPGDTTFKGQLPPAEPKAEFVPGPVKYRFEVFQPGLGESFTRRNFEVKPDGIFLTRLQIRVGEAEFTFNPTPAVRMMDLGEGEGATWTGAGTDAATGTSMVVEGSIEKRELIDVCGKVFDTYRVLSTERIVNLTGDAAFSQMTQDADDPPFVGEDKSNIYNVGTQYGGIFLREEVHTVTTIAGLIVTQDNVSTISDIEPGGPVSER